jgi:hypothetical protein
LIRTSSIDKGEGETLASVKYHPRGGCAPEQVVAARERFYKIDQDTFSSFASNVLLHFLDTNIKLITRLQLGIKQRSDFEIGKRDHKGNF